MVPEKRVYLAGPMSGLPEANFPEFKRVREILRKNRFKVVCPAEMTKALGGGRRECMLRDVQHVLNLNKSEGHGQSGCVIILPNWRESTGANTEVLVAWQIGINVYEYTDLEKDPFFSLTLLHTVPSRLPYSSNPSYRPTTLE